MGRYLNQSNANQAFALYLFSFLFWVRFSYSLTLSTLPPRQWTAVRAERNSETFLQVPSNNTDRPLIGILSQVDLSQRD